jgi:hypothetical protein
MRLFRHHICTTFSNVCLTLALPSAPSSSPSSVTPTLKKEAALVQHQDGPAFGRASQPVNADGQIESDSRQMHE